MIKKIYQEFNETVFYEKLDNGLNVILLPKNDYNATYANLKLNFGSINNQIEINNKIRRIPEGTAHFLEHKMFDKKNYDSTDLFDNNGAYSNAFTSFNSTNYLFSATKNISKNIKILLDMVQEPYFSKDKIKKEIGIIEQEILMYASDPNSKIYFDTISNLFPNTSLSSDIAGTVQSLNEIDEGILYDVYKEFYIPENMTLTIVGHFELDEMMKNIKNIEIEKPYHKFEQHDAISKTEMELENSKNNLIKNNISDMNLHQNKVAIAYRGNLIQESFLNKTKYELCLEILFNSVFSENSSYLNDLYNQKVIDDSFEFSFEIEPMYSFIIFINETTQPTNFINAIKNLMDSIPDEIDSLKNDIDLQKKEIIGNRISSMNSLEDLSSQLGSIENGFINIFDEINIINEINLNDIKKAFKKFIDSKNFVTNIIK
ncbi:insulinase family protein [Lactobacillus sp. S2-2]|uniref:EF-P 5-aminopentanol modification-associated protein YfmH n=1 Tax=Lactobacillus sp. S2-2 TaxID=2692917 RepID=UPI001F3911A8|nr:pitrilysin family protein [Lactobacillus sp. S2-2]MCF6515796.1 insulinase family protein [Lactobacillus sp. S2-2]